MNFEIYREYINAAGNITKENGTYANKLLACKNKQDEAKNELTKALSALDLAQNGTAAAEVVKSALVNCQEAIVKSENAAVAVDTLVKDTKKLIQEALTNVLKFNPAYESAKKEFYNIKGEIVLATETMRRAFAKADISNRAVDEFLALMKTLTLYEMTQEKKTAISDSFKDVIESRNTWFRNNTHLSNVVREDLGKKESKNLENILKDALDFTEKSREYGENVESQSTRLKVELRDLQDAFGLDLFNNTIVRLEVSVQKEKLRILALYEQMDGADAEFADELTQVKIPEQIDWLNTTYLAGQWVYKNLGTKIGEKVGLPKVAKLDKDLAKIEKKFDGRLPIPTGPLAPVLTASLLFGASFDLKANVKGNLTLHNFFSAEEKKYVSGQIGGTLDVSAKVYVGLAVTVLHVAEAAVKMVLEAAVGTGLSAAAEINKGNASNLASFDLKCEGNFKFDLKGYFELKIGLTPTLVWLVETVSGYSPEATFTSSKLILVTAERNAKFNFHMPFQSKNTTIPDDTFSLDKGEWDVTYPAATLIRNKLEELVIGDDQEQKRQAEAWLKNTGTLSAKEQEELLQEYGVITVEQGL